MVIDHYFQPQCRRHKFRFILAHSLLNGLFQRPPRRSGVASLLNALPGMVTQRRKDGSHFAKNGPSLGGELGPFRFGRLGGERTRLFQEARQTFVPVTIAGFGVDYFGPVSAIGQQPEP
jgi:hypothetical protein